MHSVLPSFQSTPGVTGFAAIDTPFIPVHIGPVPGNGMREIGSLSVDHDHRMLMIPDPQTDPAARLAEIRKEWGSYGHAVGCTGNCPGCVISELLVRVAALEQEVKDLTEITEGHCDVASRGLRKAEAKVAALQTLAAYAEHDPNCALRWCSAGRPTPDGGYEHQYNGTWYQVKPVDKRPPCTCGLTTALADGC